MEDLFKTFNQEELPVELKQDPDQAQGPEGSGQDPAPVDFLDGNQDITVFFQENIAEVFDAINFLLPGKWKLTEPEIILFKKPIGRILNKYLPDAIVENFDFGYLFLLTFIYFNKRLKITDQLKSTKDQAGPKNLDNLKSQVVQNDTPGPGPKKRFNDILNMEDQRNEIQDEARQPGEDNMRRKTNGLDTGEGSGQATSPGIDKASRELETDPQPGSESNNEIEGSIPGSGRGPAGSVRGPGTRKGQKNKKIKKIKR